MLAPGEQVELAYELIGDYSFWPTSASELSTSRAERQQGRVPLDSLPQYQTLAWKRSARSISTLKVGISGSSALIETSSTRS